MPEVSEHAPGTPSWVDLGSPDLDASVRFYGELFGWEATEAGPVEETGGYRMFSLRGKWVAGLGPLQEGQPPSWTTYVSVADAAETAEKVQAAGGQTYLAPMDVLDVGRMAIFADPAGAVFAVWQPRAHKGAQVVNEPGALSWTQVNTRDVEGAKAFYGAVFGWGAETSSTGEGTYTEWKLGGRSIAGMLEMGEDFPPEVPPHWLAYFGVADCDAAAAQIEQLGGQVHVPPTDIPEGRFAVGADPQGASFGVWAIGT
jgi:uncharacterized protein